MNDRPFFDTNILIYAYVNDPHRTPPAEQLLRSGGQISVQVLNEFTNVLRRKTRTEWGKIAGWINDILVLCGPPSPVTLAVHEHGFAIARSRQLRIYDGLIVAAALQAGCNVLYSEDLQDGQEFERQLTVRNPFLGH